MKNSSLKTFATGLAAVALVIVFANSARATLITIGDPAEIGSWGQGFNESGVGNFTQVETIMRSGGPFESPGFAGLAGGWTVGLFSANQVVATGPAINNMTWTIRFLGSSSSPLVFDFYAWNGNTLAERARASWNGGGWTINGNAEVLSAPTAVPEPTTMIAGLLLLLPLGASTLRILRKKA